MEFKEGVLMYMIMFMFLMHEIMVSSTFYDEMYGMSPNRSIMMMSLLMCVMLVLMTM